MNSASDADRIGARRRSSTLTSPMYASVFCSRISPRVHTIQFPPRRWSRGTRDPTGISLRADVAAASRRRRHEWALSVPLVPSRAAGNSRITSPPPVVCAQRKPITTSHEPRISKFPFLTQSRRDAEYAKAAFELARSARSQASSNQTIRQSANSQLPRATTPSS